MTSKIKGSMNPWGTVTAFYLGATYATLGIMPSLWNGINGLLGGNGLILQYSIYSATGLALFSYILLIKKERSAGKYLLLALFTAVFMAMFHLEERPAEKIHMAQYGLFGVLIYKSLRSRLEGLDKRLYIYGSLISFLAGAIDEVLQGFLPNRHFTWHDVAINGLSSILTLLIIRFNVLGNGAENRQPARFK